LATLKPQAGIMAPVGGPAAPAQPVLNYSILRTRSENFSVLYFALCCSFVILFFDFILHAHNY